MYTKPLLPQPGYEAAPHAGSDGSKEGALPGERAKRHQHQRVSRQRRADVRNTERPRAVPQCACSRGRQRHGTLSTLKKEAHIQTPGEIRQRTPRGNMRTCGRAELESAGAGQ